jgi:hypothetical protein
MTLFGTHKEVPNSRLVQTGALRAPAAHPNVGQKRDASPPLTTFTAANAFR